MNKKEIAQQFTRRMLGQESDNQSEKQMEPEQQDQLDIEQLRMLLKEIPLLYNKAQDNYRNRSERQIDMMTDRFGRISQTAINLSFQLEQMMDKTDRLDKLQNRILGRWTIRIYLICILVGCCSALMTLLIVWIKIH